MIFAATGPNPSRLRRLWFIAAFPPPINGQSSCNAALLAVLADQFDVRRVPLGTTAGSKIVRALMATALLLWHARSDDSVYVSLPGQRGAWLMLPLLAAARLRCSGTWLHHHSYRSINLGPQRVMRAIVGAAGRRQMHILLSDGMRDRFSALYLSSRVQSAIALSNAFLLGPDLRRSTAVRPARETTLGHMSVLTREKGVLYLLSLFEELRGRHNQLRLVIAGPTNDPAILDAIAQVQSRHPGSVDYRGLLTGPAKEQFYRDTDIFMLPTTLIDEAEPLVMLEAYAAGVEVVATPAGCIPDRIRDPSLLLSGKLEADISLLTPLLGADAKGWDVRRAACRTHAERLAQRAVDEGATFLTSLSTSSVRTPVDQKTCP